MLFKVIRKRYESLWSPFWFTFETRAVLRQTSSEWFLMAV